MANETTTATLASFKYAEFISANVIDGTYSKVVMPALVRQENIASDPTLVASVPKWPALTAAAVAEATDLTSSAITPTDQTITASEVGIMTVLTDKAQVSSIISRLAEFGQQLGKAVADKIDADLCALLVALNGGTAVGTSGTNMTVANLLSAVNTVEKADAPMPYVCVLHPQQIHDLRTDLAAATGVIYTSVVNERIGVTENGYQFDLYNIPIYATTNVPTANTAADYAGGLFSRGVALGMALKWGPKTELERNASLRGTEIVATTCYGVGELVDTYGVPIVTDA